MDSPSGSAKTLTETLLKYFPPKKQPLYDTSYSQIDQKELHLSSKRIGSIVSTHTVIILFAIRLNLHAQETALH
ncbi:MAG: hypothetical protein JHC93_03045 [Parachlamydiales bacterium]|nr:hypothetical protein [Parachlamydiales bacterium]